MALTNKTPDTIKATLKIKAQKVPRFKPGKAFRDAVN